MAFLSCENLVEYQCKYTINNFRTTSGLANYISTKRKQCLSSYNDDEYKQKDMIGRPNIFRNFRGETILVVTHVAM